MSVTLRSAASSDGYFHGQILDVFRWHPGPVRSNFEQLEERP